MVDKDINRFIVLCVEQYAHATNKKSANAYKKMSDEIINDLVNDYDDLHGMSSIYLNNYIASLLGEEIIDESNIDEHQLAKTLLIVKVTELIANRYSVSISEARDMLYHSNIINLIDDDETGLYGESPLYVLSLFEEEKKK